MHCTCVACILHRSYAGIPYGHVCTVRIFLQRGLSIHAIHINTLQLTGTCVCVHTPLPVRCAVNMNTVYMYRHCVPHRERRRVCIRASATRFWLSGSGAIGATPREGCGYIDTHTHIPPCKIHHGVRTACLTGRGVCVHMPPSCDTAGDFDLDFTGAQPSLPPCEGAHGVFVAYLAGRDGLYTVAPPSLPPCEDAHRIA